MSRTRVLGMYKPVFLFGEGTLDEYIATRLQSTQQKEEDARRSLSESQHVEREKLVALKKDASDNLKFAFRALMKATPLSSPP